MSKLFRSKFFRCSLSQYQWYRKFYGGRWEYHYIGICNSAMWLEMKPPRVWPDYVQPCSHGTPTIEDWPVATLDKGQHMTTKDTAWAQNIVISLNEEIYLDVADQNRTTKTQYTKVKKILLDLILQLDILNDMKEDTLDNKGQV